MSDPERRARICATIRLAAQMVERDDPRTQLVSKARITRLDEHGRAVGTSVTVGPLLFTMADVDPEAINLLTGEA